MPKLIWEKKLQEALLNIENATDTNLINITEI